MRVYDANGIKKVTGVTAGRSMRYFKQVGTSPYECWYLSGAIGIGSALSAGTLTINTMIAVGWMAPRTGTIDGLGINVTTLAALGKAKVLMYNNTSDTVQYPSSLLAAAAEFDVTTTGVKTDTTLSIAVTKDTMYWFVYWCGTNAPGIRSMTVGSMNTEFLGFDNTFPTTPNIGFTVAQTYSSSTNPSTYPSSATMLTTAPVPAMFHRYSA